MFPPSSVHNFTTMTLIRLCQIILRNFLVPIHDMDCIWPNQLVPECRIRKSAKKFKKTIPNAHTQSNVIVAPSVPRRDKSRQDKMQKTRGALLDSACDCCKKNRIAGPLKYVREKSFYFLDRLRVLLQRIKFALTKSWHVRQKCDFAFSYWVEYMRIVRPLRGI